MALCHYIYEQIVTAGYFQRFVKFDFLGWLVGSLNRKLALLVHI